MCAQGGPDEDEYGIRIHAGRYSDAYLQRVSWQLGYTCLLYTSPSPRDRQKSRMPSSA